MKDLPPNAEIEKLKKISGVKHVISATVDQDNIRGLCTGTGRIKMRLTNEDNLENIKLKYVQEGYAVIDHIENPKKKSQFT